MAAISRISAFPMPRVIRADVPDPKVVVRAAGEHGQGGGVFGDSGCVGFETVGTGFPKGDSFGREDMGQGASQHHRTPFLHFSTCSAYSALQSIIPPGVSGGWWW